MTIVVYGHEIATRSADMRAFLAQYEPIKHELNTAEYDRTVSRERPNAPSYHGFKKSGDFSNVKNQFLIVPRAYGRRDLEFGYTYACKVINHVVRGDAGTEMFLGVNSLNGSIHAGSNQDVDCVQRRLMAGLSSFAWSQLVVISALPSTLINTLKRLERCISPDPG